MARAAYATGPVLARASPGRSSTRLDAQVPPAALFAVGAVRHWQREPPDLRSDVVDEVVTQALRSPRGMVNENHKWIALFITTLGMLMAAIDGSIVLIALPAIFRGIHLDPLLPSNTFFLLWMILGFLIVTSVLVVSLGKLGDLYGRVRMYNLGFAVFTFFSLLLSITWMTGTAGGVWLIVMRIFQGIGAALLMANSAAILTDAFPPDRLSLIHI